MFSIRCIEAASVALWGSRVFPSDCRAMRLVPPGFGVPPSPPEPAPREEQPEQPVHTSIVAPSKTTQICLMTDLLLHIRIIMYIATMTRLCCRSYAKCLYYL